MDAFIPKFNSLSSIKTWHGGKSVARALSKTD